MTSWTIEYSAVALPPSDTGYTGDTNMNCSNRGFHQKDHEEGPITHDGGETLSKTHDPTMKSQSYAQALGTSRTDHG